MPTDILQILENGNNDGDTQLRTITGGLDIIWGASTNQHERDLLLQAPGDDAWHVTVGVDIEGYQDDDYPANEHDDLHNAILTQFTQDGMTVKKIDLTPGNEEIDAKY